MANLKIGTMCTSNAFGIRKMDFLWKLFFEKWLILRVDDKNDDFPVAFSKLSLQPLCPGLKSISTFPERCALR